MTDPHDITQRYVRIWNEPDPVKRRCAIEDLWTPDGIHVSQRLEARGYDELERRVADTYAKWVVDARYAFAAFDEPQMHHHTIRFRWKMIDPETETIESIGLDFFMLDGNGRVRAAYQFIEQ